MMDQDSVVVSSASLGIQENVISRDIKTLSSYPVGLGFTKYNIGNFLKSDPSCVDSYASISSSLNQFSCGLTSRSFFFSNPVPQYLPHRKRRENKPRRQRTTFSSEQTLKLEMEYRRAEYVTRTRRLELADDLQLTETQIKIWYQNRRAKDKRIEKAHLDQHFRSMSFNSISDTAPYPAISAPVHGMYGWDPWILRTQIESASPKAQT